MPPFNWDRWRQLMMLGALAELAAAVWRVRSPLDDTIAIKILVWGGYALLAGGFVLAMRRRQELREAHQREQLNRPDPDDRSGVERGDRSG